MNQYDYIISGAGAAGLSLLMRMMQHPFFDAKKILVIDKLTKTTNDRTWCFWEQEAGLFEPVVHHRWKEVHFYSNYFSSRLNLQPYEYKMIRGLDFYNYVLQAAQQSSKIHFIYGEIEAVGNEISNAFALVNGEKYTADYVFNSILFARPEVPAGKYFLLQHFKGFIIETGEPAFDPAKATLMDFRVSQHRGTTFVYVLPLSTNRALVEYTLFTKNTLQTGEYDKELHHYIQTFLLLNDYRVMEEEAGSIPMTNIQFVKRIGRVINIGTAGGQTKASSGYTFQFIQKYTQQLVNDLVETGMIKSHESFAGKRFRLYDSTLLNILHHNKLGGDRVFADLFKKNPADRVLRFLDNESTLEDEINIMASVPSGIFMRAALQEIFK